MILFCGRTELVVVVVVVDVIKQKDEKGKEGLKKM